MIKLPFQISGLFVSFSVVLAALVVGTSYSTFQRDLQLLKVGETGQYALPLFEVTTHMIRLEYEVLSYTQNGQSFSRKLDELGEEFLFSLDSFKTETNQYMDLPEQGQELFLKLEAYSIKLERRLRILERSSGNFETTNLLPLISEGRSIVKDIQSFANSVAVTESETNLLIQDSIRSSSNNSMALSFLTVLLSILGMVYFIRLNSQNEMMARKNQDLADRSEASSLAKSRLLSMLSHEIRTPMNGVLGLVSLGLHQKLSNSQRKLMEQIRGSAMELITFLEDMLDFSSLEEINVKQTQNPIHTPDFIVKLNQRLQPVFLKHGKYLTVSTDESLPKLVKGDAQRIQQCLYYLLSHISKTSSEKEFKIRSTLFENYWVWRIDLQASENINDSWKVDSQMSHEENFDFIASDTFETAMARGMIESMHGEIRLLRGNVQKDMYRLLVYIPVQIISPIDPIKVFKYPDNSEIFDIKTILGDVPNRRLELHQLSEADLILCNPDNSSELKKLSELRKAAPFAYIVSVGATSFPDLYDDVFIQANNFVPNDERLGNERLNG